MEIFYKRGIANNCRLYCVLTYEDELTLMVGKSCLATLGSANSFGIQVSALTSKGQVGMLLGEHRGWMLHMAFLYKAKILCTTAFFPRFQHTAFYFPPFVETNGPPLSPERETCCMLSICGAFEFLPLYKRTFRFTPAICKDCTAPRIQHGFLLSKDKVLSLLATSLLNRNPYGFPINGSPVF